MKNFVIKMPYYLFITILVVFGALLFASATNTGGLMVKIVKSGSMEPTIKTGGVVFVRPTSSYKVGDIITFGADTKNQIPTTHRITSLDKDGSFVTKGDNNDNEDSSTVLKNNIKGKVFLTIPYLGFILDFAKKPLGFILLVALPALVVVFDEVSRIINEIKRIKKNKLKKQNILQNKALYFDGIRPRSSGPASKNIEHNASKYSKNSRQNYSYKTPLALTSLCLLFGFFSFVPSRTISYYNEVEKSAMNRLQAGIDFGIEEKLFSLDQTIAEESGGVPVEGEILSTSIVVLDGIDLEIDTENVVDNTEQIDQEAQQEVQKDEEVIKNETTELKEELENVVQEKEIIQTEDAVETEDEITNLEIL